MSQATLSTTFPLATARGPQSTPDALSDDYVPADQIQSLLDGSLDYRQKRLAAADMISSEQAAHLVNTTRVTVNNWIAKGRAIGLTQIKRGYRLPRWQFEPVVWRAIEHLAPALGSTEGWSLLRFLETPQGALDGRTPRQAIEQGDAERVIEFAKHSDS